MDKLHLRMKAMILALEIKRSYLPSADPKEAVRVSNRYWRNTE